MGFRLKKMHERQARLRAKDEDATKVKLAMIAAGMNPDEAKEKLASDITGTITSLGGDVAGVLTGKKPGSKSDTPPPNNSSGGGPLGIPIIGWVVGVVVIVFVFIMPKK